LQGARKNPRAPALSARIGTTVDILEAKGGATHDDIVRGAAAHDGQAVVEYAAILALVAAVTVAGYRLLGTTVLALFQSAVNAF
jgi:Flp pilus assembly pilin Flp